MIFHFTPTLISGLITAVFCCTTANPALIPGVWKNITPVALDPTTSYGIDFVQIDPSHPSTIYICCDTKGLWKSINGGESWLQLGNPSNTGDTTTSYIDSPIHVEVDPSNSQHLYVTQGVRGTTLGFWISNDGGNTWTKTAGFKNIEAATTSDVTSMAVDPSNFNHVLVGSHSSWPGLENSGFIETTDGGKTWKAIQPQAEWNAGSKGLHFLYDPRTGQGNSNTWMLQSEGAVWRTTDAGVTWTRATPPDVWPNFGITHHGSSIYYTKKGVLYAGAFVYPIMSTNNGVTWTSVSKDLDYASYYVVAGDGNNLYTCVSFTGDNSKGQPLPFKTSKESDGVNWTTYNPQGTEVQTFSDGPFNMPFDSVNRIIYASCWKTGVWALKVIEPSTTAMSQKNFHNSNAADRTGKVQMQANIKGHNQKNTSTILDIRGRYINGKNAGTQAVVIRHQ